MNKQNQKGFTLLEIMVTVAIVGILAAIIGDISRSSDTAVSELCG
jgi:prepilin-type N-terminal cleavage/methylation domain-containing protein